MLSNHLILSLPLLLLPSIFPSIRSFPVSQLFTSGGQSHLLSVCCRLGLGLVKDIIICKANSRLRRTWPSFSMVSSFVLLNQLSRDESVREINIYPVIEKVQVNLRLLSICKEISITSGKRASFPGNFWESDAASVSHPRNLLWARSVGHPLFSAPGHADEREFPPSHEEGHSLATDKNRQINTYNKHSEISTGYTSAEGTMATQRRGPQPSLRQWVSFPREDDARREGASHVRGWGREGLFQQRKQQMQRFRGEREQNTCGNLHLIHWSGDFRWGEGKQPKWGSLTGMDYGGPIWGVSQDIRKLMMWWK